MEGSMLSNIWRMFAISDIFIKFVIIFLIVLSGYSWAIIIAKWRRFRKLKRIGIKIRKVIGTHRGVEILRLNLPSRDHPVVFIVDSIRQEIAPAFSGGTRQDNFEKSTIVDALEERSETAVEEALEKEERHIDYLAMVSNIAPFLGLLGTVWGITGSFWEIGQQASANIAIVAPGLAEALITTIIGLIVAIPAAIAFNFFNTKMKVLAGELSTFSKRFITQLKREL